MAENENTLFRQKTLERISSPEQLTDYLRVTSPGIWAILAAVIILLTGIFAWASVGTLETTTEVKVIVQSGQAQVIATGSETIKAGMPLRAAGQEYTIASVGTDEYGRTTAMAAVDLEDGTYDGTVVVESIRPLSFLVNNQ